MPSESWDLPEELLAKPFIEATELSLEQWLELLRPHPDERETLFTTWCFPTTRHRQEYLESVADRSDVEIKSLLRNFLILGGSLGCDRTSFRFWSETGKLREVLRYEYVKRMLNPDRHTWEGNTWILDLLPHWPQQAVDAISAYITAHCQFLPDGRWDGLEDAQAVIRARYLDVQHPQNILMDITSRQFELLVAHLYRKMGYVVALTPPVRDGGYDIRAERTCDGMRERLLIECKRYGAEPVRVAQVRALAGVVDRENATRGVLVTTSYFTQPASNEADLSGRVELIDRALLNRRLNEHLWPDWPHLIDKHLREAEYASLTVEQRLA